MGDRVPRDAFSHSSGGVLDMKMDALVCTGCADVGGGMEGRCRVPSVRLLLPAVCAGRPGGVLPRGSHPPL